MNAIPEPTTSYWIGTSALTSYEPLSGEVEADVAVIGAGIVGICTAWELTRAGRRVVLIDAGPVAHGVTGFTTAKVSSLHGLLHHRVRETFGPGAARLHAQAQQGAIERVRELVRELEIDCDLERVPAFGYTADPGHLDEIRAEARAAAEAGLPASYVTESPAPFPLAGAVRVEDQAQFHPRRFLLALLADLTGRGCRVFEHTRAVGLREGQPCRVETESGAVVRARDVVVATHYPVFDRALLFGRLVPRRELVVAGPIPLQDDPGGMYVTSEEGTHSVRTAPYDDDRRLLIVTGETFHPGDGGVRERYARLAAWAHSAFPRAELRYRWAAQDNGSSDGLPYVGLFHLGARHVYVATGFAGWGMTNGVMSGRLLTALICGDDPPPWKDLYDPRRLHPLREGPSIARSQLSVVRHFVGDRLRVPEVAGPAAIAPGAGAVLRRDGHSLAVYRDRTGGLHCLSATCTHLGCQVAFNDAEHVWECPCHGSRFDVDGQVLQGPATRPLNPRPLPDEPSTD
ncbi:FAD-dependent oxidoreductase [Kitasatospora sp. CMC57]|uniref:FAD-dependent oxidoreductase n=1 Tax=Kitasatospora sp. CMC57 TaxID=3231513 RepID=A0AB33JV98_9ACTN